MRSYSEGSTAVSEWEPDINNVLGFGAYGARCASKPGQIDRLGLTAAYVAPCFLDSAFLVPQLPAPTANSGALRLALLYAVIFVEIGIAMPFMPVWLNA